MLKLVMFVFLITMPFLCTACRDVSSEQSAAEEAFKPVISTPLGNDVAPPSNADRLTFDDNNGAVYFRANIPSGNDCDASIAELLQKKNQWLARNPNRKVIAMDVVINNPPLGEGIAIFGLLATYEIIK